MRRDVNLVVIHCSASQNGVSLFQGKAEDRTLRSPAQVIDGWHAKRGFKRAQAWRDIINPTLGSIGYHYVVDTGGTIESGRHLDEVGAHCLGHNRQSVGICMVGTDRYTVKQWGSLRQLVDFCARRFPGAQLVGHRDLSPDVDSDGIVEPWEWLKTCPGFDVKTWLAGDMSAMPAHTFPVNPA